MNLSTLLPVDYGLTLPQMTPMTKRMNDILTLSDMMDASKEKRRKAESDQKIRDIFAGIGSPGATAPQAITTIPQEPAITAPDTGAMYDQAIKAFQANPTDPTNRNVIRAMGATGGDPYKWSNYAPTEGAPVSEVPAATTNPIVPPTLEQFQAQPDIAQMDAKRQQQQQALTDYGVAKDAAQAQMDAPVAPEAETTSPTGLSKSDTDKYNKLLAVDPDYAEKWASSKLEQNYKVWQMRKQEEDIKKESTANKAKGLTMYATGMASVPDLNTPEALQAHQALRQMVIDITGDAAGIPDVKDPSKLKGSVEGVISTYMDPLKKAELAAKAASTAGTVLKNETIAPESKSKIELQKAQTELARANAWKAYQKKLTDQPKADQASMLKLDGVVRGLRAGPYTMAKTKIQRAEALEALIGAYGSDIKGMNKVDRRQLMEAAIAMQVMLSPGSPSEHEVRALMPSSIQGDAAKIKEWALNNPEGTQQGKFLERIMGTVQREKSTAQNQIAREMYQKLALFPELNDKPIVDDWLRANEVDPVAYHKWIADGMPAIQVVPKAEGGAEGAKTDQKADLEYDPATGTFKKVGK